MDTNAFFIPKSLSSFQLIFCLLFFKEKDIKKRALAAVLIVVGAILIATDNLPIKLAAKVEGLGL